MVNWLQNSTLQMKFTKQMFLNVVQAQYYAHHF